MTSTANRSSPASVGILGLGAFGRLMVRHLREHFQLFAFDPALSGAALSGAALSGADAGGIDGVTLASLPAVASCPVVILATPVNQFEATIAAIGPHLRPGTLVLDVGSVKVLPAAIMRRCLPGHVDIVGTHPLFGPQSAAAGIRGRKIAVCPIRGDRAPRVAAFLRRALGLQVIVTTPEAHDREAATVQGLTHLIAKVLVQMEPLPTRMTTASFDMLVGAIEMVRHDAPEVFLAIEQSNPYSPEVRRRFFELAAELDADLEHAALAAGQRSIRDAAD